MKQDVDGSQREIMAIAFGELHPVKVIKAFRHVNDDWAVTPAVGWAGQFSVTHVKSGMCAGGIADTVEDAIRAMKAVIKEKGPTKTRAAIAHAKRERSFLDRKDKIRAKALAKLNYWERRALGVSS